MSARIFADGATPKSADPGEGGAVWHGQVSLRIKGLISLLTFVAYVAIVGVLVTAERERLLSLVHELEQVHRRESQLVQVNIMVARAVISSNEHYLETLPELAARQIQLDLAPLQAVLGGMLSTAPELRGHLDRMQALAAEMRTAPTRGGMALLRSELHRLVLDTDRLTQQVRGEKEKLMTSYRLTHDKVTLETLSFALLGVVVFGALVTIFFTRLTWDIRRVAQRAVSVVKGYRGDPLEVTRGDDVGGLMMAVNDMQQELRHRETQLELARQQQFHHEKMAAVGSLASAIAHEINNPIMAIAGVAQSISENQQNASQCGSCDSPCQPELILEQTRRISQITRQISEFTVPQSPEPQLLDLNGLLTNTCNFVRFDKRFRRIDLKVLTDPQAPAVFAVADEVTQVMINLLINAADALEQVIDRRPEVTATTRATDGYVEVVITDNGTGMDEATRARAFEQYFTTKGPGRGTGLGLFLCRSLVESNDGEITITSQAGVGTQVTVRLPVGAED